MQLFHPRIIAKHIENTINPPANHVEILQGWAENLDLGIYDSETKNDGQFIQRILVDVLGYTESSGASAGWTLTKNHQIGSGNVDVALGNFEAGKSDILAPFELKGAKTRDLDAIMAGRNKTPVEQAWEYGTDNKGTKWVLVSNYREIRLYAYGHGRKEYERFDLSKLTNPKNYAHFILLLSPKNLLNGHTLSLLRESEKVEKQITDALYQDYKALRSQLISSLTEQNPDVEPLEIIQFSQTILDRILFIAFAEDKGLLPKQTLKDAYETQNNYNPQPVWENFKGLFEAIDKGSPPLNITGYNGGLFSANPAIDNLSLNDELCEGFKKIGDYDFDSDVSVNILGHIFEQSITDLEEIKAHVTGELETLDKKKSKRKKDGIFYTPPYITNYIVEQAVGGWLKDRQAEIGFDKLPALTDEDYASIKISKNGKVSQNAKVKKHIKAWQEYKTVLSNIKVLDPACGSGAFLNEVFDYLKSEGEAVNSQLTEFNGGQAHIFRWDTHILANNIYGVDLNNESVEITKLSLWLKTANKGEKLTYLDNNIKCGNSLIDDPAIAGDSAFDWNVEFADIMQAGGFDVVVGNPPYGAGLNSDEKEFIKKNYKSTEYNYETYISFFELTIDLLCQFGYYGSITPNTYLVTENSTKIRRILLKENTVLSLLEIFNVFPDAVVEPIITIGKKRKALNSDILISTCTARTNEDFLERISLATVNELKLSDIFADDSLLINYRASNIALKLAKKVKVHKPLSEVAVVTTGVKPYQKGKGRPKQTKEDVSQKLFTAFHKPSDAWKAVVRGGDVNKYQIINSGEFIHYGEWLAEPRSPDIFFNKKLFIRRTDDRLLCCYDDKQSVGINSVHCITSDNANLKQQLYCLMSLINSKLLNWVFQFENFHMVDKPLAEVKVVFVERLPIANCSAQIKEAFEGKAEVMLTQNRELSSILQKLLALLKTEFSIDRHSNKTQSWHLLDFSEFLEELKKKKVSLSLEQKSEWMDYFEKQKAEALAIKSVIDKTDREIDQMVYELYGLTDDEIAIVEGKV